MVHLSAPTNGLDIKFRVVLSSPWVGSKVILGSRVGLKQG